MIGVASPPMMVRKKKRIVKNPSTETFPYSQKFADVKITLYTVRPTQYWLPVRVA